MLCVLSGPIPQQMTENIRYKSNLWIKKIYDTTLLKKVFHASLIFTKIKFSLLYAVTLRKLQCLALMIYINRADVKYLVQSTKLLPFLWTIIQGDH